MRSYFQTTVWILLLKILLVVSIQALKSSLPKVNSLGPPFWQEIDSWSACSADCGPGIQTKLFQCVRQSNLHDGVEYFNNSTCSNVPYPQSQTKRKCNWGNCDTRYIWKAEEFSFCSQTCGSQGTRFREINCYFNHSSQGLMRTTPDHCDQNLKPESMERCNIVNCLPEFVPEKWGPCIPSTKKCGLAMQRRKVLCKVILKDGSYAISNYRFCMKRRIKVVSAWQFCNHPSSNTPECLELASANPKITVSNLTVVQMRQTRKLILQIGEKAHIIPLTKVVIRCPVLYYRDQDVVWMNKRNDTYRYSGKTSYKNRIRVDKKGRLKIRKFQPVDEGTWYCIANSTRAKIILRLQTPSSGSYDWARRMSLRNKEMPNEETVNSNIIKNVIQWVSDPWSPCSKTCGSDGTQTRRVRCERVDSRFYHILEDSECTNKLLPKPKTQRSCSAPKECPAWSLSNLEKNVCTGECIEVNQGLYQATLRCLHQNQSIDYKFCDAAIKPNITCYNKHCQVAWRVSEWSKCSRSCGDSPGIMARHLTCVWTTNDKPAGRHCYKQNVPLPEVVRSCNPPPCNLRCVDMSPYCGKSKNLCRYAVYRYQCCQSCSKNK